jgi:hypothetical protein
MTGFFGNEPDVIKIVNRVEVRVPTDVMDFLNKIHSHLDNDRSEYGVYLKGTLDKDDMVFAILPGEENMYLPSQKVTAASLQFTEDPPHKSFNAVVHRHPAGMSGFSGTDRESINQDYDMSMLFIPPRAFPAAVVNLDMTETTRFQVEANVRVVTTAEAEKFIAVLREKIRERTGVAIPGEVAAGYRERDELRPAGEVDLFPAGRTDGIFRRPLLPLEEDVVRRRAGKLLWDAGKKR